MMNQAMIAMALTLVVYYLVPKYVTKPTNIKIVDDMVMGIKRNTGYCCLYYSLCRTFNNGRCIYR